MRIAILCTLFLALPVSAQIDASGFIGVNPATNFLAGGRFYDRLDSDWKPGLTVGAAGELFITSSIAVSLSVEYAHYAFDNYTTGASMPEWHFISASGKPSRSWRLFLEVELFSKEAKVLRVYVSTGAGYLTEKLGDITVRSYVDGEGAQTDYTRQFRPTNLFVHTAGLGFRFGLPEHLAADIKGQCFTDYTERVRMSFKVALVYTFTE